MLQQHSSGSSSNNNNLAATGTTTTASNNNNASGIASSAAVLTGSGTIVLEPGAFCVLGRCDNRYTTETVETRAAQRPTSAT